ncbi:MAG: hypothetical protein RL393_78, partial [Actinomycetota bacterium]
MRIAFLEFAWIEPLAIDTQLRRKGLGPSIKIVEMSLFVSIGKVERYSPGTWARLGALENHGGRSSAGRAPGCGPGCRGFKPRRSPHFLIYRPRYLSAP